MFHLQLTTRLLPALLLVTMLIGAITLPVGIATAEAQTSCRGTIGRLDVVFLIDQTGSMSAVISNAKDEAARITTQIRDVVSDSAFGVASFSDYPLYSSPDDRPYTLDSGISTDVSDLQNGLATIGILPGGDGPEAYSRAIYEMPGFNWRKDAKRVVVLMGDSYPHSLNTKYGDGLPDPGPDGVPGNADDIEFADAVSQSKDAGITIVGLAFNDYSQTLAAFSFATDDNYEVVPFSSSVAPSIVKLVTGVVCSKPKAKQASDPAHIIVYQDPDPNTVSQRNGIVTYSIVVKNLGKGSAKETVVTMPFDASEAKAIDATFSRKGPWVSKLITNTLEFRTGPLASNGDTVTATVRLATLPAVANNTSLSERLTYRWADGRSGGNGRSNLPILTAGGSDNNQQFYTLNVEPPTGPAGSTHRFTTGIFAPDEPITFWYNAPDGTVEPLNNLTANTDGAMNAEFSTKNLKPGTYSMVARGNWTGFTAVGMFQVQ